MARALYNMDLIQLILRNDIEGLKKEIEEKSKSLNNQNRVSSGTNSASTFTIPKQWPEKKTADSPPSLSVTSTNSNLPATNLSPILANITSISANRSNRPRSIQTGQPNRHRSLSSLSGRNNGSDDSIFQQRHSFDINFATEDGRTALHFAAGLGLLEITQILLQQHYIRIDAIDKMGNTPLHVASSCSQFIIVKLLVERGANTFVKNVQGNKPIDY
ncbi:hypothetical protein HK096_010553, partial [Nowakowskiella sp. JEL0078]